MATKKDTAKSAPKAAKTAKKTAAKSAEKSSSAQKKSATKGTPKAAKKAKAADSSAAAKARVYQPHEVYTVGEVIRHPGWNEEGTITDITETPDGLTFIVVDFGARGNKRLVVDYSLKI